MYLDRQGRALGAGHESAGVTAPSTQWFLAEGATGNYFDLFILIANPQAAPATVQAEFLLVERPGHHEDLRRSPATAASTSGWISRTDAALADAAMSTRVTSTNGVPIIVERSMWWPGSDVGHLAGGAQQPGRDDDRHALGDGRGRSGRSARHRDVRAGRQHVGVGRHDSRDGAVRRRHRAGRPRRSASTPTPGSTSHRRPTSSSRRRAASDSG